MRKFLIVTLICFFQNISCQIIKGDPDLPAKEINNKNLPQGSVPNDDYFVYNPDNIDLKPQFPGGSEALENFIKNNYKNPKKDIKGRVYVQFIIEKDGSLSEITLIRDIGYGTGSEGVRVLKMSPKWIPGKLKNKLVRTFYTLPMFVNHAK